MYWNSHGSIAGKISAIDAMRYDESTQIKKKKTKGYDEICLNRLTIRNLIRNKKRTAITIITLSITGILFIVIATVLTCANPKEIARNAMPYDYRLSITSKSGDKSHPERDFRKIQQDNPLNEKFKEEILGIEGVEKVEEKVSMKGTMEKVKIDGEVSSFFVAGLDNMHQNELNKDRMEGSCDLDELLSGDKIILNYVSYLNHFHPMKVGDQISMELFDGDDVIEKTLKLLVLAIIPVH